MELLIIRHGLPVRVENEEGGPPADPELSETGHDQARRLAEWLAAETIDAVYVSPMQRARQTSVPLAESHGLEPVVDDELSEFDRDAHFYIPVEELKAAGDPRYEQMMKGEFDAEVDPYTFRDVVTVAIERIVEANPGKTVAVVCHGGVINAYASHVLGIDFPLFFQPDYTSVNRFMCSSRGHRSVSVLNDTGHLRGRRDGSA